VVAKGRIQLLVMVPRGSGEVFIVKTREFTMPPRAKPETLAVEACRAAAMAIEALDKGATN
jgi:hypothetical protein